MEAGFLVEQFGQVRVHQAPALNFHLNKTLEHFDRQYEQTFCDAGSVKHQNARAEYAEWLAKDLLDVYRDQPGVPTEISTKSKTDFHRGGFIEVESVSTFNQSTPAGRLGL